jgi:hypothetical protein
MMKRTILLFVLVFVIVSCAPPLMRIHYFPGAKHYQARPLASLDLLRSEPSRPHEALAEIRISPSARMSRQEVERQMRERAAAIGADALVIEVDNVYHERVWVGNYRGSSVHRTVVRERIIMAVAIRYH